MLSTIDFAKYMYASFIGFAIYLLLKKLFIMNC